jgi:hypothetical protein
MLEVMRERGKALAAGVLGGGAMFGAVKFIEAFTRKVQAGELGGT